MGDFRLFAPVLLFGALAALAALAVLDDFAILETLAFDAFADFGEDIFDTFEVCCDQGVEIIRKEQEHGFLRARKNRSDRATRVH